MRLDGICNSGQKSWKKIVSAELPPLFATNRDQPGQPIGRKEYIFIIIY